MRTRPTRKHLHSARQFFLPRFLRVGAVAGVLLCGGLAPGAEKEPLDAPPKLISTTGGGPKWKNLKELKQFAGKGDPKACFELAGRYFEGDGVEKDAAKALALYEQAAKGGVGDASFRLGKIYHDGLGVEPSYAKAMDYYLAAAKAGVPEAQYNIGAMLASGRGVKRDYVEGLAWLIVATKAGAHGSGEKRLRERLAEQPADIAAAERHAKELEVELKGGSIAAATKAAEAKPGGPPPPVVAPPPLATPPSLPLPSSLAVPAKPVIALPKLDPPPPAKISIPITPSPPEEER